ncbi:MAG: S8 family peptidase [Gemmatimonadetes bacterium]|nr:S8 family peptidase [Gemmatimonadota bacterium]
MRRSLPFAAAALVLLSACAETPSAPDAALQPQAAVSAAAPIYMVTFRDGVPVDATTAELARNHGLTIRRVRHFAARGFTAVVPEARVAAIKADPRVLIVEMDGPVSLILPIIDKAPGGGGGGGQKTPWGITRVGGSADGTGKTAWIIDTGIDLDHPDLNVGLACSANFSTGSSPDDGNGHGTHVAGIIAAKNNTIGVVGVAAGATVCAVRVLNNAGSGTWSDIVAGVDYVKGNGHSGDVANMSLGGSGSNTTLEKAIQDASANVVFALAAGNIGENANYFTPARLNCTHIYTISAIDSNDCMPYWSNWGNPPVDFAAPGVSVLSLYKGGGTRTMSGTSMAAPHAAGVLLLGTPHADGTASCDQDLNPDPIIHR